jgi:hypothetical protein
MLFAAAARKRTHNSISVPSFIAVSLFAATLTVAPTAAQVVTTGTPGSPDATTTVDGRYLPAPPQKFEGQIGLNASQSKAAWPARIVPQRAHRISC